MLNSDCWENIGRTDETKVELLCPIESMCPVIYGAKQTLNFIK